MKFNVFISFKNTDNGQETRDSVIAKELYLRLEKEGVNAFFSNVSLMDFGEGAYKDSIEEALSECSLLVVISTKAEYLSTRWVKYEWESFQQDILSEIKDGTIITYLDQNIPISDVPRPIRHYQSFKTEQGMDAIVQFIKAKFVHKTEEVVVQPETPVFLEKERSSYTSDYRGEEQRLLIQAINTRPADMPAIEKAMSLIKKPRVNILDVGCAYGYVGKDRFAAFDNVFVLGVDINERVIEKAAATNDDDRFAYEVLSVEAPEFKSELRRIMKKYDIPSFDIVFGALVLHHLVEPIKFLRNVREFVNDDGYLIMRGSDDGTVVAYNDEGLVQKIIDKVQSCAGKSDRFNGRKLYYQLFSSGYKNIEVYGYLKDVSRLDFDERHDIYMERFDYRRNYFQKALAKKPDDFQLKNDLGWINFALDKLEDLFGNESFWYSESDICALATKKK